MVTSMQERLRGVYQKRRSSKIKMHGLVIVETQTQPFIVAHQRQRNMYVR